MSIGAALIPEFDHEMATTRRMLERVPSDKGQWKPHPKSFPLGHLAQLLSWMPGWIDNAVREDSLDLAQTPKYSFEKTERLLADFDAHVKSARQALSGVSDETLAKPWSLSNGSQVYMTLPKSAIIRNHITHLSHHRGQMSVYLRLLDVPVPMVYGPTADERMM
ncbi:MAG TPA: DinB family protein [Candidatus Eisenbacteria bacterium]|nr:DinB family protein [Candidatus Eisenbacteria bacterium]